jgi:beta-galactosidase
MPAIKGSVPKVDVGILTDLDQNHLWSTMSHELPGPYPQQKALFEAFARRHYAVGMVEANDELAGYRVLILPSFAKVDAELIAKLKAFVEDGGTVLATAHLGTRDARNHKISTTPPGGGFDELFGLRITEWGTTSGKPISINYGGKPGAYTDIYEIADLKEAESIASWIADREGEAIHQAVGHAALTRNIFGQGEAWYFTSLADGETADDLVSFLEGKMPIEPLASADPFVEVVVRQSDGRKYWFVLNHYAETKMVAGLPSGPDLLTEIDVPGMLKLEPYGVAVILG